MATQPSHHFFDLLSTLLWRLIVTVIVLLAVYVSLGRLLAAQVEYYREDILGTINAAIPGQLEVDKLTADWQTFSPTLALEAVTLRTDAQTEGGSVVRLDQAELVIDVFSSVRSGLLSVSVLTISGLTIDYVQVPQPEGGIQGGSLDLVRSSLEILMDKTRRLLIDDAEIRVLQADSVYTIKADFDYWREASNRQLRVALRDDRGGSLDLQAEGVGNPLRVNEFEGYGYGYVAVSDNPVLRQANLPSWITHLIADTSLRTEMYVQARPNDWRFGGDWAVITTALGAQNIDASLEPLTLSGSVRWDTDFRRSKVKLFAQQLDSKGTLMDLPVANLELGAGQGILSSPRLELDAFLRLADAISPDSKLTQSLASLAPSGVLDDVRLHWRDEERPQIDVTATLVDVGFRAVGKRAGATGISGDLTVRDNRARLRLDSQQIALELPGAYPNPLRLYDSSADVYAAWTDQRLYLRSANVQGRAELGQTQGKIALRLPWVKGEEAPEMELMIGVETGQLAQRNTVIPSTIAPSLERWLQQAIGQGQASDLGLVWRGSLAQAARQDRSIGLFGRLADLEVTFLPDWPSVTIGGGQVIVDDEHTSVWVGQAELPNVSLSQLRGEIWPDSDGTPMLTIATNFDGPIAGLVQDLEQSAMAHLIPDIIAEWSVQGVASGNLALESSLRNSQIPPDIAISAVVQDFAFEPNQGLVFSDFEGSIYYSTAGGFQSDQLIGQLWNNPIEVSMTSSRATDTGIQQTHLMFTGSSDDHDLASYLGLIDRSAFSGTMRYDGQLLLSQQQAALSIRSDLTGLSLELPEPLRKQAQTSWPTILEIELSDPRLPSSLALSDHISVAAHLGAEATGFSVGLNHPAPAVVSGQALVSGSLSTFNFDEWRNIELTQDKGTDLEWRLNEIEIGKLIAFSRSVNNLTLTATETANNWTIAGQAPWISAQLAISEDPEMPLSLIVTDWDLGAMPEQNVGASAPSSGLDSWPKLEARFDTIRNGEQRLGGGRLAFYPSDDLFKLVVAEGDWRKLAVDTEDPLILTWDTRNTSSSQITGSLLLGNAGQLLEEYGYEPVLQSRSGRATMDLHWPGGPELFEFAGTEGALSLTLNDGKFLKASSGAKGALRVITILNFADIVNRLSLTQLFESGVPFDKVQLRADAQLGLIDVSELYVNSSSSQFQFAGSANLLDESLTGRLTATLPVANNLPWLAALTGGLPAAAGVYVISKIFEKQVDRFSSAVYQVSGTWQEPILKFDRLFDTQLDAGPTKTPESASQEDITTDTEGAENETTLPQGS